MALRYKIKSSGLAKISVLDKPVPLIPMRQAVEYVKGGDLRPLIAVLQHYRRASLAAGPGAGKSLFIPMMLAEAMGAPVIQVVPGPLLADHTVDKAVSAGVPVVRAISPDCDLQMAKVTVFDASQMVSRWLGGHAETDDGSVLYLDEAHATDAYTHVLRTLSLTRLDKYYVVHASATLTQHAVSSEYVGRLVETVYAPVPVADWAPSDAGKPWSASNMSEGALIFMDDFRCVDKFRYTYQRAGFQVHVLDQTTTYDKFRELMAVVTLPIQFNGPVILLADSTFRTGFEFPLPVIIDTCEVSETQAIHECGSWTMRISFRSAYSHEITQAKRRIARRENTQGYYYRPDYDPAPKRVRLDGLEVDAAAILIRMLGYRPDPDCAASLFLTGRVFRSWDKALNGTAALRCLTHALEMCELSELVSLTTSDVPSVSVLPSDGVKQSPVSTVPVTEYDFHNYLDMAYASTTVGLDKSKLYYCPESVSATTDVFRHGKADVVHMLTHRWRGRKDMLSLMGREDLLLMATALCEMHTLATVEHKACDRALEAFGGFRLTMNGTEYARKLDSCRSDAVLRAEFCFSYMQALTEYCVRFEELDDTEIMVKKHLTLLVAMAPEDLVGSSVSDTCSTDVKRNYIAAYDSMASHIIGTPSLNGDYSKVPPTRSLSEYSGVSHLVTRPTVYVNSRRYGSTAHGVELIESSSDGDSSDSSQFYDFSVDGIRAYTKRMRDANKNGTMIRRLRPKG